MSDFSLIVEKIKTLSLDEKQQLQFLLQKFLTEARREEIKKHYDETKNEEEDLKFSGNINELKKRVSK